MSMRGPVMNCAAPETRELYRDDATVDAVTAPVPVAFVVPNVTPPDASYCDGNDSVNALVTLPEEVFAVASANVHVAKIDRLLE